MTTKLTVEQREALKACAGLPVRVADESTSEVFYLVNEDAFAHLRSLQADCDEQYKEKLRALIAEGINSAEVTAARVFADLRAEANKLTGPQA
jgi:hypothetical protein